MVHIKQPFKFYHINREKSVEIKIKHNNQHCSEHISQPSMLETETIISQSQPSMLETVTSISQSQPSMLETETIISQSQPSMLEPETIISQSQPSMLETVTSILQSQPSMLETVLSISQSQTHKQTNSMKQNFNICRRTNVQQCLFK